MLLTPGWGYLDEPKAETWKRSAEAIGEIAEQAEREGVTILLEHLTPASSNLINCAEDLNRMCRESGHPEHDTGSRTAVSFPAFRKR